MKLAKCGSVDSKYFGKPNQFEEDVKLKHEEYDIFREKVRNLILKEADKIDLRYIQIISILKELKEEFEL